MVLPRDDRVGEGEDGGDGPQGVAEGRPAQEGHAPQEGHRGGRRQRCHPEKCLHFGWQKLVVGA